MNDELHSTLGKLRAGLRYLVARRGPLALSVNQFGGFARANPAGGRPDVQLYFNPVTYGSGDAQRTPRKDDPEARHKAEMERMRAVIAEITAENLELKKKI